MRFAPLAITALTAALLAAAAVAQQPYPSKPVRLIIPFPPGGSNDVVGRRFGQQLGERLAQPVIIENRGGAGGTIGTDAAAKAAPDGYTLLLVSIAYSFSPAMYKNLPYDPAKAFAPIAPIGAGPVVLAVHPGVPIRSVKELIDNARAKPAGLKIASAGIGSFQHLAYELFRLQSKVELLHVPYKGGGPALTDVLGGHAEVTMGALVQTIPHIRAGKLRALGVSGNKRNTALPEVPTIAEAALPDYDATNWWGIVAPAGTSAAIIAKLHSETTAVVGSAETRKRLESEGAEGLQMSSADFGRFIQGETAKWSRVVVEAGMKGE